MKKILFVVDERKMGGVSILLSDILNNINTQKLEIDVLILHNNGNMLENLPKNITIIYGSKFFRTIDYSFLETLKTLNPSLILNKFMLIMLMKTGLIKYFIKKERKEILKKKYDKEIAFKDGFCGLFVGYGDAVEKIQWLHCDYEMKDYLEKYKNQFLKLYNEHFNKIIAISEPVKNKFNKKYKCEDKTFVINNLVDTKKIKKLSETPLRKKTNKMSIISVGRFHYMKGFPRLIRIFNRLNKENLLKNVNIQLIGDGPEYEECSKMIEEMNLKNKLKLLGNKNNPFPYVKNSDLFILGSLYEPFGLTVIEALTLGVPVLAADTASIHEMLNENIGIIVDNDEQGLYEGLKYLIENPQQIKLFKQNLKKYNYDNNIIIKKINNLLK